MQRLQQLLDELEQLRGSDGEVRVQNYERVLESARRLERVPLVHAVGETTDLAELARTRTLRSRASRGLPQRTIEAYLGIEDRVYTSAGILYPDVRIALVKFRPDMPPEYLPADQARARLVEEAERALRDCASAVVRGDIDAAISHAGYASRAHPEQPLARLALIALSRDRLAESQIWFEKLPLDELDRDSIKRAFRSAGSELRALKSRIENDPLAREYELLPRWLKKRRDSSSPRSFSLPSEPWGRAA